MIKMAHSPDLDTALSKHSSREEAARCVETLMRELARLVYAVNKGVLGEGIYSG